VSGHTDEATNPRFDDHKISASSKVPKASGGHSTSIVPVYDVQKTEASR